MKIYTILIISILIFFLLNTISETFQSDFTLPKVKIEQEKSKQTSHKNKFKFNIDETIKTGSGVHDRIRYQGKWN